MRTEEENIIEGVLVPAGWDTSEKVVQTSLFTQQEEDILLKHSEGLGELKPFINQKVRVVGDIESNSRNERTLLVSKISKLPNGFTDPLPEDTMESEEMFLKYAA
jgi:hypothetical protein